jgi:hypothetical protein
MLRMVGREYACGHTRGGGAFNSASQPRAAPSNRPGRNSSIAPEHISRHLRILHRRQSNEWRGREDRQIVICEALLLCYFPAPRRTNENLPFVNDFNRPIARVFKFPPGSNRRQRLLLHYYFLLFDLRDCSPSSIQLLHVIWQNEPKLAPPCQGPNPTRSPLPDPSP